MASMENNFMSKQDKKQVAAMKAKRLSLERRKACIRKKTMELSVLCDVDACVCIVDDDGSEVETWPENQRDVLKIINKYKKCDDVEDDHKDHDRIVVDDQNENSSWDDYLIDGLPIKSLEEVLIMVDTKLEELVRRIEAVKIIVNNHPDDRNKGKEKMINQTQQQQQIITEAPNFGRGFKAEESGFCFDTVVFGSSSAMGAATAAAEAEAEAKEGFLSMQSFLQTPCVQESSNQSPHTPERQLFSSEEYLPVQTPNTTFPAAGSTPTLMDLSDHYRQIISQASNFGCFHNDHQSAGFYVNTVVSGNNNNNPSASHEHRFFNYMEPLQINPFNIQPVLFGQQSDQILYYLPPGQYLQPHPHHQFTANGLFPGQTI